MYMFEKNRIVKEIAQGTNKIVLDPNDSVIINTMVRRYADIVPPGEALKEKVFHINQDGDIETNNIDFNLDYSKNVDISGVNVTDEIFNQALNNILYYISEIKKKILCNVKP